MSIKCLHLFVYYRDFFQPFLSLIICISFKLILYYNTLDIIRHDQWGSDLKPRVDENVSKTFLIVGEFRGRQFFGEIFGNFRMFQEFSGFIMI